MAKQKMYPFLTERDIEILKLSANFNGRMYLNVLEKTIWLNHRNARQQSRNRMNKLTNKYKLFIPKKTGLASPRSVYVLSETGKSIVRTLLNVNISSNISISPITTLHNIMEMITFYYLAKLQKNPQRTIVANWSKTHKHTPDIYYQKDNKSIYVEIEKSFKNAGAYNTIFVNMLKDGIYKVLYVVESERMVIRFAKALPRSEKLMLIAIDDLIKNAQNGKIGAKSQSQILAEIQK